MDVLRITASELKCACADPEWLRRWIAGERPSTRIHANANAAPSAKTHGALFHRLAENFIANLVEDENAASADTSDLLWERLYRRDGARELDLLMLRSACSEALELAQALRSFCGQIARARAALRVFETWSDVYAGREHVVQDVAFHAGNTTVFVSGRVDSLRRLPTHELEIADYKLHRSDDRDRDLLQLAIYGALLTRNNPGLRFSGVIEYYQPALEILRCPPEELAEIFERRVLPIIERIASRDPGSPTTTSAPPSHESNGPHAGTARQIEQAYMAFKIPVEVFDTIEAPQVVRYLLRPAAGVKYVSLANRADDLQVNLGLETPPLIHPGKGAILFDVIKTKPDVVRWRDVAEEAELPSPVSFVVGLDVGSKPLIADLADPNSAHALVAGSTGSGKSEFLKSMLASLMFRNRPQTLRLTLIDPKRLAFGPLEGSPFLEGPVLTDIEQTIPVLQKACDEMESRYDMLLSEGFNDLASRFAAGHNEVPYRVFVFDEFADLVLGGRETRTEFETLLKRLAQKGRAAGFHLVLATQRPDRSIVSGLIKANLPFKVCLRVTSTSNSMVMLDEPGGEALAGRGDLLCNRGRGIERAQSPYVEPDELARLARG
jgi:S-DNA-T family DNA segregation ATPase FtsK/SpoIIIE